MHRRCAHLALVASAAACFPSLEQYYPPEGSAGGVGAGPGGGSASSPCAAFEPLETLASGQAGPRALVVDDDAVFWVNETVGGLGTVAKIEGTPKLLLDETAMYAGGQLFLNPAMDLASDGTHLYWVMGNNQGNSLIISTDEAGGQLTYTGAAEYPEVAHLAVDGANVFYLFRSTVYKCPKGQACPPMASHTPVAVGEGTLLALALDGAHVYFTDLDGRIRSANKSGAELPVILAEDQGSAFGIAVDGSGVYWTTDGGAIRAAPSGGLVEDIASNRNSPTGIAVDADAVYWIEPTANDVMCVPKAGGDPVVIASEQDEPFDVAVDASGIYWVNRGGGQVMARRRAATP